jgi:hypothetical protein
MVQNLLPLLYRSQKATLRDVSITSTIVSNEIRIVCKDTIIFARFTHSFAGTALPLSLAGSLLNE